MGPGSCRLVLAHLVLVTVRHSRELGRQAILVQEMKKVQSAAAACLVVAAIVALVPVLACH